MCFRPIATEQQHYLDALQLAHDVVEQHVATSGHVGRDHGADDGVRGQGGLQGLRLKPPVEDLGGRRSHELQEVPKTLQTQVAPRAEQSH